MHICAALIHKTPEFLSNYAVPHAKVTMQKHTQRLGLGLANLKQQLVSTLNQGVYFPLQRLVIGFKLVSLYEFASEVM